MTRVHSSTCTALQDVLQRKINLPGQYVARPEHRRISLHRQIDYITFRFPLSYRCQRNVQRLRTKGSSVCSWPAEGYSSDSNKLIMTFNNCRAELSVLTYHGRESSNPRVKPSCREAATGAETRYRYYSTA